ncbi:MAG: hypothetical protein ACE5E8_01920 [Acidimicrobiia bacterium]
MRYRWCAMAGAGALVAGLIPAVSAAAATGDPVLLNEVFVSHTGTDDTEYVELIGDAGFSLDGLSLIAVESDDITSHGAIDYRLDFGVADVIGANSYYLIGNPDGLAANYGVVPNVAIGANTFENSSATYALVETASIVGSDATGAEVVVDAVALTDGDAGDTFWFGAPVVGPDGSFFPAGARRDPEGIDTDSAADWVIADFNLGSDNTPAGGDAPPPPPPPVVTVMEIQGSGQFSTWEGITVETVGVVTAITDNGRDMWIQDPAGDGDPATSDGIFVDDADRLSVTPVIGDLVRIVGEVEEQQFGTQLPRTRIDDTELIELISSGNPPPAPVLLTDLPDESILDGIDFWEPLEGMLVEVRMGTVVAATSGFGEFAMVAPGNTKLGSGYHPNTHALIIRSLGRGEVDYNPERILVDDATLADPIETVPGDLMRSLTGIVDYTFGAYKLQPTAFDGTFQALRSGPVSSRSGSRGDTTITTFNVENLFDLVDNPDKDDIGTGGAADAAELETQLTKLALAVRVELRLPDVLVVEEVENTGILQELGDRVNAAAGTDYVATSFETSDGRGIEVGFLWDDDRVDLLDAFQITEAVVPGTEAAFGPSSPSPGREPLVGVFRIRGHVVTIIGNHFKSKRGDDPLFGINWPPIRVSEAQRKGQAHVVRAFVDMVFDTDPHAMVMVTGDLNDFEFGEPGEGPDHPAAILAGSRGPRFLSNLLFRESRSQRWSFVFDGNSQILDHMLVSQSLGWLLAGTDILHFNTPFPVSLGEDPTTALRASDHDALEGRFRFAARPRRVRRAGIS